MLYSIQVESWVEKYNRVKEDDGQPLNTRSIWDHDSTVKNNKPFSERYSKRAVESSILFPLISHLGRMSNDLKVANK